MSLFIGNVILHAGMRVNLELAVVDRATKARVVLTSIFTFGIAFRVVWRSARASQCC
jgi:hypothetical protein